MNADWKTTTIGALIDTAGGELQTGPFGSQLHAHDYAEDGPVRVVPTSAIGRRRIDGTGVPRISSAKAAELARHRLRAGDILFARRGVQAAGLSALVTPDQEGWLCGTGAIRLRIPSSVVDNSFLSFALSTEAMYQWIRQHAIGATMPNLNESVVRGIPIRLPPLDEQRRIATVLSSVDDRIELNRQMSRTLEKLVQTLFKSWFVDFDNQNDLQRSEVGRHPAGWPVVSLDELISFDPRVSLAKGSVSKWVDMAAVPTSGPCISSWEEREYNGGSRFMQGDVLLARITPCLENGKTALVDILAEGEAGAGSTEFIVMRGRGPVPSAWVYCLARSPSFRECAIRGMTGSSGRQRVSAEVVRRFRIARPPEEMLGRFGEVATPLFSRISIKASQSRTLTALRDLLLPKLISGQLRVPRSLDQALEILSVQETP